MVLDGLRLCPACEGRRVEYLYHQRFVLRQNHPLADGYKVVVCVQCGFAYADISASQVDYDEYYAELSKHDHPSSSTGSGESGLDRERLNGTVDVLTAFFHRQTYAYWTSAALGVSSRRSNVEGIAVLWASG